MEKILPPSAPQTCRGSTSGREDSRVRTFLYLADKEGLQEIEALSDVYKRQTSAVDGGFSFANVPYGNWLVREIEAPTGFVLSEESFAVTVDKDGAVIEVEIKNTLIRGLVQLTKTDKDYPDNKLTGADFIAVSYTHLIPCADKGGVGD